MDLQALKNVELWAEVKEDGKMLVVDKKVTGNFDYDDGLTLKFDSARPRHLQFYCKTARDPTLAESESCNLRLYKYATKEKV